MSHPNPGTRSSLVNLPKSHVIITATVKNPQYAYAHLELITNGPAQPQLDVLQARSYCQAAASQFLGLTGASISIDILKVERNQCWVRLPREHLSPFAASITAWPGTDNGGKSLVFRILGCAENLGTLISQDGQNDLWR